MGSVTNDNGSQLSPTPFKIGTQNLKSAIGFEPETREVINTTTLNKILAEVPWPVPQIGYLNVDCEGHDLEVLRGIDLDKYQPVIITIEALSQEAKRLTVEYLVQYGYQHMETIYRTLLFIRQQPA